ncbi:MAG TPA: hypothetical protein GXX63_12275 [Tissierellia bacterium]|nr:hypothetical protein [Tissierellia bacterium]
MVKNQKKKLEEVTTGLETIVGESPTVEIEGKTYTMRRLGIRDAFRVIKIIGIGVKEMAGMINFGQMDAQAMTMAMVAAIPYAEEEIIDLLASLIGVSGEEIRDPNLFPLGSEIAIIEALTKHQDLRAFFTQLQRLAESNPAIKQAMQEAPQNAR